MLSQALGLWSLVLAATGRSPCYDLLSPHRSPGGWGRVTPCHRPDSGVGTSPSGVASSYQTRRWHTERRGASEALPESSSQKGTPRSFSETRKPGRPQRHPAAPGSSLWGSGGEPSGPRGRGPRPVHGMWKPLIPETMTARQPHGGGPLGRASPDGNHPPSSDAASTTRPREGPAEGSRGRPGDKLARRPSGWTEPGMQKGDLGPRGEAAAGERGQLVCGPQGEGVDRHQPLDTPVVTRGGPAPSLRGVPSSTCSPTNLPGASTRSPHTRWAPDTMCPGHPAGSAHPIPSDGQRQPRAEPGPHGVPAHTSETPSS